MRLTFPCPSTVCFPQVRTPAQGPHGWRHMWTKQGVVQWKPAGHATELRYCRFPEPDPPHPGTQGRGGVKTWRAFAWSPWACSHLLPAPAQLATFDPTKFELKRGWWQRSSSLLWRRRGGCRGRAEVHGLEMERTLVMTWRQIPV